jgi:branched-chain amino acid transport system substrate-binding protein
MTTGRRQFARVVLGALIGAGVASGAALAQETLKMGALATLEGPFTVLGQDGMRGVEMALKERNYTAGGKKIELIKGSSNAQPDSAVAATRKLVEQDKVQILIGPLSGSEGIAVKDYAKNHLEVTF